jgi:hypothetical protein
MVVAMAGKGKKTTKKTVKKPPSKAAKKTAKKAPSKTVKKPIQKTEQKLQAEAAEAQSLEEFYLSSLAYRIRPLELMQEQAMLDLRQRQQKIKRVVGIVVITALFVAGIALLVHTPSVVPKPIANSVSFPVYYPDPKRLPNGYILDTDSFSSPVKDGVSYTVNYDTNKKVVFSVQVKPSDSELQTFNSSYIPLRIDYKTKLGQAEIGAYHSQTLVSVPVNNGPWIIITAPEDINPAALKQIIQAIRKP